MELRCRAESRTRLRLVRSSTLRTGTPESGRRRESLGPSARAREKRELRIAAPIRLDTVGVHTAGSRSTLESQSMTQLNRKARMARSYQFRIPIPS